MTQPDKIWIDEFMKLNWEGTIITSPFLSDEIVEKVDMFLAWGDRLPLEGFEQVLGRPFKCGDCKWFKLEKDPYFNNKWGDCQRYGFQKRFRKPCQDLELSDKTREIINHIMFESDYFKIDIHPRHFIKEEMMYYIPEEPVTTFLKEFNPKKNIPIRQALFKLELIL